MRRVTVVGASLAGLSAARALRAQGFDGELVLVGGEHREPYDRPPLSKELLAGTATPDDLRLTTPDDDVLALDWRLGTHAVALDPSGAAVQLDDGGTIHTDGVVIATGAVARTLPGPRLDGVHTLRTLDDALALRDELVPGARLVVIGAGFIGAEVASTANALGCDVTVVELQDTPLAGPLGTEMGAVCGELHGEHGVRLHTGVGLAGLSGNHRVHTVRLTDGRELAADVVLAGIGATPSVGWLAGSGVQLDDGVVTDEHCRTALPGVVAVGDCARSHSRYTGGPLRVEHWTNALHRPAVAAAALLGREHTAPPLHDVPYFWSDQYGVKLQFAGHRLDGDTVELVDGDPGDRSFVAVYRRGARPVAVLAMNQPKAFNRIRRELATAALATQA